MAIKNQVNPAGKALTSYGKRELIRLVKSVVASLDRWTELGMALAAYYFNVEPHARIYVNGTFTDNTLAQVKRRSADVLPSIPYTRVIYLIGEDVPPRERLPVDLIDVDDPDSLDALIQYLTTLKKEKTSE